MRIPSGDLAPARKRRRGYSSRRRSAHPRRSPVVPVLAVLLVLAIAGGAWWLRREDNSAGTARSTVAAQLPPCPSAPAKATAAPAKVVPVKLPAPGQVQLRLLNGSGRSLLARTVGNELARRGFRVAGMGNAPQPLTGASRIYFGPGARPGATLLAAHVMGAQLVPVATAAPGSIDAVLGSGFVRLRTAPEVSVAARKLVTAPVATKAPASKPSPTCR